LYQFFGARAQAAFFGLFQIVVAGNVASVRKRALRHERLTAHTRKEERALSCDASGTRILRVSEKSFFGSWSEN
jgi:hypothetical protein